ncbi:ribonuclease P protein component [Desulfobacterium sp. N47]|uniref:ribonuclease P protein component n=1 Tax=Desulfobacterium sp. N47 TaxID=3115210 RepID=UPI003C85B8BF
MQFENSNFLKTERILKRREFYELSKKGNRIKNKYVTVIYSPGSTEKCRLGLTVTKKIGNSVQRNRIKRYIREFFRVNKSRFKNNWDINVIPKSEAANLTFENTHLYLLNIFKKIEEEFDN